jgi:site-specific DNA recombinase
MRSVAKSNTEPLRAAIYIRVSDGEQEDNYSFTVTQEQTCRKFIVAQGWQLDDQHVYRDILTGSVLKRPDLERVRGAIARREVNRVVVYRLDRFGRDADERAYLRVEAKQKNVSWVSATEKNDETPEGRLVEYIGAYAAGWERRALIQRTQDGLRARVASGKRRVGCKPPYGYMWTDDRDDKGKWIKSGLVISEPEAGIVRRIYQEMVEGRSMRSIAQVLNREGVPTPNPKRCKAGLSPIWHTMSIHHIVANPVYMGRSVAGRYEMVKPNDYSAQRIARVRPEEEWQEVPGNEVPPIVDRETWERAQARRAIGKERSARSKTEHKDALLMGGIARCAYCDKALHVLRSDGRVRYRCGTPQPKAGCRPDGTVIGTSIEAAKLDREVWMSIEQILGNPGLIAAKLRTMTEDDTAARELAEVQSALADVDRQEANLSEAIAQACSPAAIASLTKQLDKTAERRSTLKRREADAQLRHWARQAAVREVNDLTAWCEREKAELARLDFGGKRERLERLGVKVHLARPDAFEGRWSLTLEPHGITVADLRDGQMLGSNCTTYRHQLLLTPSVSPFALGRCDNHHRWCAR